MNRTEYERALEDTRKAIYKGNLTSAVVGVLRAFVAHNDPNDKPPPRQLRAAPRKTLAGAKKKKARAR